MRTSTVSDQGGYRVVTPEELAPPLPPGPDPVSPEPLKRYDLIQTNLAYTTDHEMERSDDGEWVRYEDIAHLVPPPDPRPGVALLRKQIYTELTKRRSERYHTKRATSYELGVGDGFQLAADVVDQMLLDFKPSPPDPLPVVAPGEPDQ